MNEFYFQVLMSRENYPDLYSFIYYTEVNEDSVAERLKSCLHTEELRKYESYISEARKKSYLLGRYCAKRALEKQCGIDDLSSIHIEPGVFMQPVVRHSSVRNTKVSISHSGNSAIAVAYPEGHPMALDLELITQVGRDAVFSQLTEDEKKQLQSLVGEGDALLLSLWTAKECLGKVLGTGLTTGLKIFEIENITISEERTIECTFKNFIQYKTTSVIYNDKLITLLAPKRTRLCLRN